MATHNDDHDPAARQPQGAGLDRRFFVGGCGLLTAGLATGLVTLAPDFADGMTTRPGSGDLKAEPVPSAPRPIQYPALFRNDWLAFRDRYVTADGRIIDTGNGGVSHSEGQGWGMLAAQAADDQQTFETIRLWTRQALQRRPSDSLHSWRYRPRDPNPVADPNNATDGDLFIAAALARAAVRWNRPDYAASAGRIARDILGLVRRAGPRTVLLPGAVGFERADAITLNPSYYAFALFADLAAVAPSPVWARIKQDGLEIVEQGRFGRWMLPPDWLRVDRATGALSVSAGWPPRFSYDAIRVPLHLAWANQSASAAQDAFRHYWLDGHALPPAWVDLHTQETAGYNAPPGFQAVACVAMRSSPATKSGAFPTVGAANDYYSAGLILLSRLAAGESGPAA